MKRFENRMVSEAIYAAAVRNCTPRRLNERQRQSEQARSDSLLLDRQRQREASDKAAWARAQWHFKNNQRMTRIWA